MKRAIQWSTLLSIAVVLLLPRSARAQDAPRPIPDLPAAEQYRIEALVGYWSPSAGIIVSSDAAGIPGSRIDLRSDLDFTNRAFPELQFMWRPALRHKFRFQYIPIHFDSTATLARDLIFNGVTFHAGVPTSASLEWTTYRFGYEYDFIARRRASAGLIAEVRHTVVRAALQTALAGEVSRQEMPIPALGGIVRAYPAARLSLTGEVTFFGVPDRADGHYGGHVVDVDLSAVWTLTRHIGAQAGFRDVDINHLGEWNTATFTLKGAYLGALFRY